MNYFDYRLIAVIILAIVFIVTFFMKQNANKKPENQNLDIEKQKYFESMMQMGERLVVVCPENIWRKYYWAVTDRRLLIEGKQGLSDIPRSSIKRVVGKNAHAEKCKQPNQVMILTVVADKKYTISDGADNFSIVVKELMDKSGRAEGRSSGDAVVTDNPAGSASIHTLLCLSGYFSGGFFPLEPNETLIFGRDPRKCNIVYGSGVKGVSRLHCRVDVSGERILLTDLGSTCGTFLRDGQRIAANQPRELRPGDCFYLASQENMFQVR